MLELDTTAREAGKGALEDKEEPKPKQGRNGGKEGGESNGKKRLDSTKKNAELKGLLTLMMKSQLRMEQRVREIEGALMMTFVGKAEDLMLNEISCQTQAYQAKVKGQKNHGLGPPHVYAFQGFIAGLVKHHEAGIGQKNLGEIQMLKAKLEDMKWEEVLEEVLVFRVSKVYDKEKRRITLMLAAHLRDTTKLVGACLEQIGWEKKEGKAPPSHMERELQAFLEEMLK